MALWIWIVTLLFVTGIIATHEWDENGYVFFCLCMGKFVYMNHSFVCY